MALSAVSQWLKGAGRLDAAALRARRGREVAQPAGRRGSTGGGRRLARVIRPASTHKTAKRQGEIVHYDTARPATAFSYLYAVKFLSPVQQRQSSLRIFLTTVRCDSLPICHFTADIGRATSLRMHLRVK